MQLRSSTRIGRSIVSAAVVKSSTRSRSSGATHTKPAVAASTNPPSRRAKRKKADVSASPEEDQPAKELTPSEKHQCKGDEKQTIRMQPKAMTETSRPEVLRDLGLTLPAVLLKRPSATIKSPYVADVRVQETDGNWIEALAHVPCLDLGGSCVPDSELLVTRSANPKAKTQYAIQLVRANEYTSDSKGCWIGAHPLLGNSIAKAALERGLVPELEAFRNLRQEVTLTTSGASMRVDFILENPDTGEKCAVEVKNSVCADYPPEAEQQRAEELKQKGEKAKHQMVINQRSPYVRHAIFPWGKLGQEYEGRKVVSERAIKHLKELAHITRNPGPSSDGVTRAAVLMVVNREDCEAFRACQEACQVFAETMEEVRAEGVQILVLKVAWQEGKAIWQGSVPYVPYRTGNNKTDATSGGDDDAKE